MPVVWKSTVARDRPNVEEVPSLPSEVLRETFAQTYEEMPFLPGGMIDRRTELREAEGTDPVLNKLRGSTVRRISAEQAMERVKKNGLEGHLTFDKDTTEEAVDLLSERKRKELHRQDIQARSPGGVGLTAAKFGIAVGTSLADPAGALLNFVPIVGNARYARWLKSSGGTLGRTGVRAGVGAAEGVAGATLYEPLLYTAKQSEQADYDMTDSLLNVAFGGVLGGGIHMIGGSAADAYRALRGLEQPWAEKTDLANAITAGMAAREGGLTAITPELVDRGGAQLDRAIDAALGAQAEPVTRIRSSIPQYPGLSTADRAIETRFSAMVETKLDEMVERYEKLEGTDGGKLINADLARELSPDYLADRSKAAAVHEGSSYLTKEVYKRRLAEAEPGGEVVFAAGGAGSGKSTGLGVLGIKNQIVYDGTLSKLSSAVKIIEQALEAKQTARIVFTYRDAIEALNKGALSRSMREIGQFGSGRTVPIEAFEQGHKGARDVFEQLLEKYGLDGRVRFDVIDNTRGPNQARRVKFDDLPKVDYNGLRERLNSTLEEARASGAISEAVYRGFSGSREGELGRVQQEVRGRSEQGRARGPSSQVGNAADLVHAANGRVREAGLRIASSQLAEGEDVNMSGLYPDADQRTALPDPDTSPQKTESVDAEIREGDDSLEAAEEFALLEEKLTTQQAKLMGVDIKPLLEVSENEAQRIDMYAQAAELAQACLVRGG